jgi:hypothetical protein
MAAVMLRDFAAPRESNQLVEPGRRRLKLICVMLDITGLTASMPHLIAMATWIVSLVSDEKVRGGSLPLVQHFFISLVSGPRVAEGLMAQKSLPQ